MATMSPASAISTGCRSRPRKARILVMRPVSTSLPSRDSTFTLWFGLTSTDAMRPGMRGPEKGAEQPERSLLDHRRRHVLEHEVEQRLHADIMGGVRRGCHPAVLARPVE